MMTVEVGTSLPLILMTDGVVTHDFLHRVRKIPDRLYVTFPLPYPNGGANVQPCSTKPYLTYCPYGYDAVILVEKLLNNVQTKLGNWSRHRSNISRADILDDLKELKSNSRLIPALFNNYRFDSKGDNREFDFTVWEADPILRQFRPITTRTQSQ